MTGKESFLGAIRLKGFNRQESEIIHDRLKTAGVLNICVQTGQISVKHGVFMEKDILRNALNQGKG